MVDWNQTVFSFFPVLVPFNFNEMVACSFLDFFFSLIVMCRVRLLWEPLEQLHSVLVLVPTVRTLFGTACALMQCAVQWVQQKEEFGNGQHTPSSGWVLYYIATHRACCTSGLNQKQNQKAGTISQWEQNHFVFLHSVSVGTIPLLWLFRSLQRTRVPALPKDHNC